LTAGSLVKETDWVVPCISLCSGYELCGFTLHVLEGRRFGESRKQILVDLDLERSGDPAHFTPKIALEVRVVEEVNVWEMSVVPVRIVVRNRSFESHREPAGLVGSLDKETKTLIGFRDGQVELDQLEVVHVVAHR